MVIPAGTYEIDADGDADPGHVPPGPVEPAADRRRLADGADQRPLRHRGRDGNISVCNSGELFGAIDVALFILVIGGFLGVTMKTGAIQGGSPGSSRRLKGRERWMIPILMAVFALGGTTFGMAEESLAFYALIITVMIAAGYDALVGRRDPPARAAGSASWARRSTRSRRGSRRASRGRRSARASSAAS